MVVTKLDHERWEAAKGRSGIYMLVFKSGEVYVGSSMDLVRRAAEHWEMLLAGTHENPRVQAAFNREGADNVRVVRRFLPILTDWELLVFERVLLREQVLLRGVGKVLNNTMPVIVRRRGAATDQAAVG